jgi:hypothetical protein
VWNRVHDQTRRETEGKRERSTLSLEHVAAVEEGGGGIFFASSSLYATSGKTVPCGKVDAMQSSFCCSAKDRLIGRLQRPASISKANNKEYPPFVRHVSKKIKEPRDTIEMYPIFFSFSSLQQYKRSYIIAIYKLLRRKKFIALQHEILPFFIFPFVLLLLLLMPSRSTCILKKK